jgi:hypothetical protein
MGFTLLAIETSSWIDISAYHFLIMANEDDAPKSAYELAMARLRKKDAEEGVADTPPTEAQRKDIAEIKKVYEARLAEREILYHASRRKARDPEGLATLEEEYRRDRERIQSERDRKLEDARRSR